MSCKKFMVLKKAVDELCTSRYNTFTVASPLWNTAISGREWRREGKQVSEVRVKENESLESALKRFKRQCARAGVLAEVRKREHYEKPSVKRKKKAEAARKRKY